MQAFINLALLADADSTVQIIFRDLNLCRDSFALFVLPECEGQGVGSRLNLLRSNFFRLGAEFIFGCRQLFLR